MNIYQQFITKKTTCLVLAIQTGNVCFKLKFILQKRGIKTLYFHMFVYQLIF